MEDRPLISDLPADPKAARAALFRDRNFHWLTAGAAVSMLGDQFTLIALPWLVLKMTGDTLVLGTVLALISVPRALFILVGGAMVDRHSPKAGSDVDQARQHGVARGAAWQGALLMGAIGMLGGFMQVRVFTWLQRRVPPALLGRAMALFMFIFMGLVPMASAVTGWLLRSITLQQLFAASGALLVLTALVAAVGSPLRRINDRPAAPVAPSGK